MNACRYCGNPVPDLDAPHVCDAYVCTAQDNEDLGLPEYSCEACGEPIDPDEDIHTNQITGEDLHADCCDVCQPFVHAWTCR